MRPYLLALLPCVAVVGCAPTVPATYPLTGGSESWTPFPAGYLAHGEAPDGLAILPPPPAPGSAAAKADRAAYLDSRKLAGTSRWATAVADADLSGKEAFKSFSCAAKIAIGPDTTPALARLMLRITGDAGPLYETAKAQYARPRPPAGDKRPICTPREDWIETNGSYPSGHALIGWSWALVLAELIPERQDAILRRGREIGDSRVVCGVHYPSDIEAGRLLGGALVARLRSQAQFQSDLDAAKTELAAARQAPPPAGCAAD